MLNVRIVSACEFDRDAAKHNSMLTLASVSVSISVSVSVSVSVTGSAFLSRLGLAFRSAIPPKVLSSGRRETGFHTGRRGKPVAG